MSTLTGWKCTTKVKLIAELQGFWAEDLWDMHHSPAGTLSPNASQRRLKFDCKSAAINGELKYVCWKKFSEGQWRSTQELTKVHLMIRWLNSLDDLPVSLICLSFLEWQALYRKYLLDLGMYKQGTTNRMNGIQQPTITARDSCYMSLLRQVSIVLNGAYDLRPPHEKDVWDLERMSGSTNLSRTNVRLGFLIVRQSWLRKAAKLYLKFCLPLYAAGTCRTRVQAIACFSDFLAEGNPHVRAKDITRKLLLDYLNYLQKRVRTGSARNNVLNLRNFLEMSHREGWLPVGPERLIYDEEVPQPPKPQATLSAIGGSGSTESSSWQSQYAVAAHDPDPSGVRHENQRTPGASCRLSDAGCSRRSLSALPARKSSTGERNTDIAGNRRHRSGTAGRSAHRKNRVGTPLPKQQRRRPQAGQLRAQDQPPGLRSRHPRRRRQALPLPGTPVPSHCRDPYGQSRSSSPQSSSATSATRDLR